MQLRVGRYKVEFPGATADVAEVFLGSIVVGHIYHWPKPQNPEAWNVGWTDSSGGNTMPVQDEAEALRYISDRLHD